MLSKTFTYFFCLPQALQMYHYDTACCLLLASPLDSYVGLKYKSFLVCRVKRPGSYNMEVSLAELPCALPPNGSCAYAANTTRVSKDSVFCVNVVDSFVHISPLKNPRLC